MAENARAQNPLVVVMWRAEELNNRGKWLCAVQCYLSVLGHDPSHVPAYLALAHIYMERKQWRAARELLQRGLLAVPGDSLLSLHLGNVYLSEENHDRAMSCYRAALRADAGNTAARYNLGLALVRQGRNAEAISCLTTLAGKRPDFPGLGELLGSTYLNIGRPDRALAVMLPAETHAPDRPRLLYLIAQAFSEQGRWPEAGVRLRKAHLLCPDDAEIMSSYGWALLRLGQIDEGVGWLRAAVEAEPTLVYAHLNLAAAYHGQGRTDEARATLEAARRVDPHNPWIASYLRDWGYTSVVAGVAPDGPPRPRPAGIVGDVESSPDSRYAPDPSVGSE